MRLSTSLGTACGRQIAVSRPDPHAGEKPCRLWKTESPDEGNKMILDIIVYT